MEISDKQASRPDYYYKTEKRKDGAEYALAKVIIEQAASLGMTKRQVDGAFSICRKMYEDAADRMVLTASDAEGLLDFCV